MTAMLMAMLMAVLTAMQLMERRWCAWERRERMCR